MSFKTYLNHPINQKTSRKKQNLRAITVFQKEGGGPARYDHDHRFNGFFLKPSLRYLGRKFGMLCAYKQIIYSKKSEIVVLKEEVCSLQNTINTLVPKLKKEGQKEEKT